MSSRYGPNLHARDPYAQRSELFGSRSASPYGSDRYGGGHSPNPYAATTTTTTTAPPPPNYASAYPTTSTSTPPGGGGGGGGSYRSATPNRKGQYSAEVLESLESQNDERVEGLRGKVKMLKDITLAINEEVRTSTSLMESMNDSFDATRRTLGRTMAGMLAMAKRTGVGWRAWVGFFAAVGLLFWWVWI